MSDIHCRDLPEAIADLIGGEGSDELRLVVERHARTCRGCSELCAGLDDILARAREVDVPEPAEHYWTTFRIELRQRIEEDTRPPWRLVPAALLRAAAAAAAVAALTWGLVTSPAGPTASAPEFDDDALAILVEDLDPLGGVDAPAFDAVTSEDADLAWVDTIDDDLFGFLDAVDELDQEQREKLLDALDAELAG